MVYLKAILAGTLVTACVIVGAGLFGYSGEKVLGLMILIGGLLAGSLSGIFSNGERQHPWNKWSQRELVDSINQGVLVFLFTLPVIVGFFINYLLFIK